MTQTKAKPKQPKGNHKVAKVPQPVVAAVTPAPKTAAPKNKEAKKRDGIGVQEFKKCPKCTSQKGFYLYLIPKKGIKKNSFDLRVSCPKCKQKFKVGLILK